MRRAATTNDSNLSEREAATGLSTVAGGASIVHDSRHPPDNASEIMSDKARYAKFNPKLYLLSLYSTRILPDIEISSTSVARSLLPTMRKLKWCLQKDRLAREFKRCGKAAGDGLGIWLSEEGEGEITFENTGRDVENKRMRKRIFVDGEKVRLALCPDVKKRVGFFEKLGRSEHLVV